MNFPTLPTDNIYKFLALGGLVLLVIGIVLPWKMDRDEIEWYWQQRFDVEDRLQSNIKYFTDLVSRSEFETEAERRKEMERLGDFFSARKSDELKKLTIRVNERWQMTDLRQLALKRTMWAGGVITVIGFFLWWLMVQRHQDAILRAEREKALKENPLEPSWLWKRFSAFWVQFKTEIKDKRK